MITVKQIIDYVMQNKRGNAFRNFTEQEVLRSVLTALSNNALIVCSDGSTITGIALAYKVDDTVIHVSQILTTSEDAFRAILQRLYGIYHSYTFEAERNGRLVRYNTEQFANKVLDRK